MLDEIILTVNKIKSHGHRGAVVPIARIDDLKNDAHALKHGDCHTQYIDWIAKEPDRYIPANLPFNPRSVIVVAVPCPKVMLEFIYHGEKIPVVLPPTYAGISVIETEVASYLNAFLNPRGFSAYEYDEFPQKWLAVHCGLTKYGRNNICYHEEFGSYIRLVTCFSDLPCDEGEWFPFRRMEICETCCACVVACPTKAIDAERLLIDADVCLTSFNEGEGAFPDRLDKSAHNALVGCIKCQDCCPQNIQNKDNIMIGVSFTDEETEELLTHTENEPYSQVLIEKIESVCAVGIKWYGDKLPRNLKALIC